MPVHDVEMEMPRKVIVNADVVFAVKSDGEKLGELRVSKGTIDWRPANKQRIVALTWEQFDKLMRDR